MQQYTSSELQHFGVKGMKWGVIRTTKKKKRMDKLSKQLRRNAGDIDYYKGLGDNEFANVLLKSRTDIAKQYIATKTDTKVKKLSYTQTREAETYAKNTLDEWNKLYGD